MPIYMHIEGIKGEVTESKHKDWVEIGSVQFGVGRAISSAVGAGKTREASLPSVSEITVTKMMDGASVEMFKWAVGGSEGKKVKIDFVSTGGKESQTYLLLELEKVMLSGYSMSSGGDKPSESCSLNFTKILYKYVQQDETGKAQGPKAASYDLQTAIPG